MNHLVQRSDVGVPEGGELGVLFPGGQGLAEVLLKLGHSAGLQIVGADFVNHGISFSRCILDFALRMSLAGQ